MGWYLWCRCQAPVRRVSLAALANSKMCMFADAHRPNTLICRQNTSFLGCLTILDSYQGSFRRLNSLRDELCPSRRGEEKRCRKQTTAVPSALPSCYFRRLPMLRSVVNVICAEIRAEQPHNFVGGALLLDGALIARQTVHNRRHIICLFLWRVIAHFVACVNKARLRETQRVVQARLWIRMPVRGHDQV